MNIALRKELTWNFSIGYAGENCEYTCPEDTYGQDCKNKCECMNDAVCDIVDGTCECEPGYEGEYCEKPCDVS